MASVQQNDDMEKLVVKARAGFMAGRTKTKEARRRNLNGLLEMINKERDAMITALYKDLHKPSQEATSVEIDASKWEIVEFLQKIDEICDPEDVHDGSALLIGKEAFIHRDPYGVCLVMGAWNYPIQLILLPLIGAIAAGNAAVIKPSELSPAVADLFGRIIPKYLDKDCFPVVNGGADVAQALLKQRFDHITYTGGCTVARVVMKAAAEHLTPVTLELGGKCPAYVDSTADVTSTASRISWGKLVNAGQTCVAPDYVICDVSLKDKFVNAVKKSIQGFYGNDAKTSKDYCRIVNERHFDRIKGLLEESKNRVVFGGSFDRDQKYIEPTILDDVSLDDPIMGEEIFGPLLPIVYVKSTDDALKIINEREKPLALYVFSSDKRVNHRFLKETSSGNLTVNDTLVHALVNVLPFGGVGNSGMGAYHGKFSVDTYTHAKSCIVDKSPRMGELTMTPRYPPYSATKETIIGLLTRKSSGAEKRALRLLKFVVVIALIAYLIKFLGLDGFFHL